MPLKIIRNDIVNMDCDAVVNTANRKPVVGRGCDTAIYSAAGYDRLLAYRKEHIGTVKEGNVFLTPGFDLKARYIIHAVSPAYRDGSAGEERKLRACYQKSLELAAREGFRSVAFPLIATGSFRYPKEEGLRIAVDEINAFLMHQDMLVYLVVYDAKATELGRKIYPGLESYIDQNYIGEDRRREDRRREDRRREDYFAAGSFRSPANADHGAYDLENRRSVRTSKRKLEDTARIEIPEEYLESGMSAAWLPDAAPSEAAAPPVPSPSPTAPQAAPQASSPDFYNGHDSRLAERMAHLSDTFSEYLLYLIKSKGMTNADVYKRATVDKKVFSKIKNNRDAHPQKITALCLCVGAQLNIDETRDLLARAGYALSPSDKTDVIFSYFIENGIYDIIQLDIELEEYGQPCLISLT